MPKRKRRYALYKVSVPDGEVVKRFVAACHYRGLRQSEVIERAMKYFLRHRYAFANGQRRPRVKGKGVKVSKPDKLAG